MVDTQPVLDRFLDLAFLVPPLDLAQKLGVCQQTCALVCSGVLALICFLIVLAVISAFIPQKKNTALSLAALATVPLLAWLAANYGDVAVSRLYIVVFIVIRAIEGLVLGLAFRRTKWYWAFPVGLALVLGLSAYWAAMPPLIPSAIIGLWFVIVAVLAGHSLSRGVGKGRLKALGTPIAWAAMSLVFISSGVFLSATPVDANIYKFVFPVAFVIGLIYFKKKKAPAPPPPAGAPVTG